MPEGARVTLGGAIEQIRPTTARKGRNAGKRITLFKVRTLEGRVSCVLFSEENDKYGHLVQEDRIYAVTGTLDLKREEPSLIVSELMTLEEFLKQRFSAFLIRLGTCERVSEDLLEQIGDLSRRFPGDFDLLLHFDGPDRRGITVQAGQQYRMDPSLEALLELEGAVGPENVEIR
jgi:DNA polymerase III alpha subunit